MRRLSLPLVTGLTAVLLLAPADTTPPVTVVIGADDAWHGGPVDLTFSATDVGSGVARTEASLDGGLLWQAGTSLRVGETGVHTVLSARSTRPATWSPSAAARCVSTPAVRRLPRELPR